MSPLLGVLLASCGAEPRACNLETEITAHAGSDATNCGEVEVDGDATVVDACVVDAFSGRAAFFARYWQQGIDTGEVLSLTGNGHGDLRLIQWSTPVFNDSKSTGRAASCDNPRAARSLFEDTTWLPITCSSMTALPRPCR